MHAKGETMRSLLERIEEWLLKFRRANIFDTWNAEIDETQRFKEVVAATKCPACDKPLKLHKFERGPKGWEAEIICEGCNFKALINSGWTNFMNIDSKGRAREK